MDILDQVRKNGTWRKELEACEHWGWGKKQISISPVKDFYDTRQFLDDVHYAKHQTEYWDGMRKLEKKDEN